MPPNADPQPRTRAFLSEPHEPLLAAQTPQETARRFDTFCTSTGLGPLEVVTTASCSVPLPFYAALPTNPAGTRPRRFATVDPRMLWHPMFWLPDPLRARYRMLTDTGTTEIESDERWAARVAVEATVAGLYDESTGRWVDVLAVHGLHVDDPADLDRVRRWQQGGDDDQLEAVDLSDTFAARGDPLWSLALVEQMLPALRVTGWTVASAGLLEVVDDLVDGTRAGPGGLAGPGLDVDQVARVAHLVASYAADAFATIPDYAGTAAAWRDRLDGWDGTPAALHDRLLPWMADELQRITAMYLPDLQRVVDAGRQALPGGDDNSHDASCETRTSSSAAMSDEP